MRRSIVLVLMMLVLVVQMLVLHRLVQVLVAVMLGQVQPTPAAISVPPINTCVLNGSARVITEATTPGNGAMEKCAPVRDVSVSRPPGPGSEIAERAHEERPADAVADKADEPRAKRHGKRWERGARDEGDADVVHNTALGNGGLDINPPTSGNGCVILHDTTSR